MPWVYFKIAVMLAIPFATLSYAREVRVEADMRALKWDVQHTADLKWVMNHPRESLEANRAEGKYLGQLIQDMDN